MNIKTQITQRISEIADQLETVRARVFDKWGSYLFTGDIEEAKQLTVAQIAFLTLFEERYEHDLYPKVFEDIYNCFFYYFDEEEKEYVILLHGLTIANIESGEWSLLYQNEDPYGPIVHLDFENWELVSTSLSA